MPPLSGRTRLGLAVVTLLLATATVLPAARALASPPPGRVFAGAFAFVDDHLQYLSFVEQAERGRFVFYDKFDVRPLPPFLVNLGWWTGGQMARLLGGPAAGFLGLKLVAVVLLVAGAVRLLRGAGLAGARLISGVAAVSAGGGLGWVRHVSGEPWVSPDLSMGLYPFAQAIHGAHGTLGTALLVWSLALRDDWRSGRRTAWPWLVCANVLGLCRPFDFAVVLGTSLLDAAWDSTADRRRAVRSLFALCWLAPVLLYNALVFFLHPSFATYSSTQNAIPLPSAGAFLLALLPSLALLLAPRSDGGSGGPVERSVGCWLAVCALVLLLPAGGFRVQFASSIGAAALVLAVLRSGTGRIVLLGALSLPTSLILLESTIHPPPAVFLPADYAAGAAWLRSRCVERDVVYGPVDPSLVVAGLSPCSVALGHRVLTPELGRRALETEVFFNPTTAPAWRLSLLDTLNVRFALLPAGRALWLGRDPRWHRAAAFGRFEIWERRIPGG